MLKNVCYRQSPWSEIKCLCKFLMFRFEHVPAKSGNKGHDMATSLARGSAGSSRYTSL